MKRMKFSKESESPLISRNGLLILAIMVCAGAGVAFGQEMVKREPAMGALKPGQRVLVDDGSCGPGKIKEVIGGNHVKVGGYSNVVRERRCIPR
jgi:hypothetical protein